MISIFLHYLMILSKMSPEYNLHLNFVTSFYIIPHKKIYILNRTLNWGMIVFIDFKIKSDIELKTNFSIFQMKNTFFFYKFRRKHYIEIALFLWFIITNGDLHCTKITHTLICFYFSKYKPIYQRVSNYEAGRAGPRWEWLPKCYCSIKTYSMDLDCIRMHCSSKHHWLPEPTQLLWP